MKRTPWFLWMTTAFTLLALSGCGDSNLVLLPDVAPLFATHGAGWNDYVQGAGWDSASDSACDAANDTACVHGGEHREVGVPELNDCSGLTADDALGAFDWVCDDSSGSVRFVSTGLGNRKYLSDLIDFETVAWRENQVHVFSNGKLYGATPLRVWWPNPLAVNNDGTGTSSPGTIYLVTRDTTANYGLATRAALVTRPGVTIHAPPASAPYFDVVGAYRNPFVWIEGQIDVSGRDVGIWLYQNQGFSVLRNVSVKNANYGVLQMGIYITGPSINNRLEHINASQNQRMGIYLYANHGNYLHDVVTTGNGEKGIDVQSSADNTMTDIAVTNNGISGLSMINTDNSRISGFLQASGNGSADCYVDGGVDPGLDDDADPSDVSTDTTHDGLCVPQGASDFTLL